MGFIAFSMDEVKLYYITTRPTHARFSAKYSELSRFYMNYY